MASSVFDLVWLAILKRRKKSGLPPISVSGKRVGLRQKRPVIDLQRIEPVDARPVIIGRQDIEHRQPRQPAGMIERQAVGDAAAAIMAGERKMHVAELLHRLDDGLRHRALGIGRVILVALRHIRPAVTRQVGDDQREAVGELRRDAVPHHMRFGKAVQQQQRRALAADAGKDAAGCRIDPFGSKTGEQVGQIGHRRSLHASSTQRYFCVCSCSTACQPISRRQKPSGHLIRSIAA